LAGLIDRSIASCDDHHRSVGPHWGMGPLAQCHPPKDKPECSPPTQRYLAVWPASPNEFETPALDY